MATVVHNTLAGAELHFAKVQVITGVPLTIPLYVGQTVVDQVTGRLYTAKGISSVSDWVTAAASAPLTVVDTATVDLTLSLGNTLSASLIIAGASGVLKWNGAFIAAAEIVDSDVSSIANIARTKLAAGPANHVVINSPLGVMSSEAQLSISRGGTGLSGLGSANSLLTVDSAGTALQYRPLLGTTNQIVVTPNPLNVTLSLPQDIDPSSDVSFNRVTSTLGVATSVSAPLTSTVTLSWPTSFYTYLVNSSGGSFTITLPSLSSVPDGQTLEFTDISGAADSFPVTLATAGGGDTILGGPTILIDSSYQSLTVKKASGTYTVI